jgi:pimeloyl-ACP methyl ester carboxylesterase
MLTRALAGTLLTFILASPGQATGALAHGLPSLIDTPCIGDFSRLPNEVECRLLIVPETRGLENGRKVVIPVVVVRGVGPQRKPDPVIVLHGGPGGGEVEGLADSLSGHPELVGDGRDWIFFDQRGSGLSIPTLDCGVVGLSDAGLTDDFAVAAARACGQRHAAAGVDLSQYNIAAIVADLADLRRVLGIDQYNLLGTSYGSRVAMGVMQRDTRGLRAVVLDSLWPPEASWTGPLPPLVSRETRKVLALCARDENCGAQHPDLERRFDALLAGWLEAPRVIGTRRYTADDVAAFLLESLYDNDGTRRLPVSIARLLGDDYSELDRFLQEQSGYVEGLFLANLCKEEFPFESADAIEGLKGEDPIAVATARASARNFAACDGFPVGRPDPLDNQPVVSPLPTLVLAAGIDAGCPVELAEAAVQRLANGQLAVFPNTTHGVRWQSQCAQGIVSRFLDEPRSPIDTACIAVEHAKFEFRLDD